MPYNIVQLFNNRQCNYFNKKLNTLEFKYNSEILVERDLLNRIDNGDVLRTITDVTDQSRSIFAIEFSDDGYYAATSHTNRTVSIIRVSTMKKVGEINTSERTIWSMSFHLHDSSIIATGSLGGQASVYKSCVLYRTISGDNTNLPISSICFHPTNNYICFANACIIKLWDWENNNVILQLNANVGSTIRYLRFNPLNNMLITGISKSKFDAYDFASNKFDKLPLITLLWSFLRTMNHLLDCLEAIDYWKYLVPTSNEFHLWNFVIHFIITKERYCIMPEYSAYDVEHPKRSLNTTYRIFNNRLEAIDTRIVNEKKDNDFVPTVQIELIMKCFRKLNGSIVTDKYNHQYQLEFDEVLLKEMITKLSSIVYNMQNEELITYDMNYYYNLPSFMRFLFGYTEPNLYPTTQSQLYTLQVWDFQSHHPDLEEEWRNVITNCTIHNDSTVALSKTGAFIVTINQFSTGRGLVEVRSLVDNNLGELLHFFENPSNMISLSISPSSKHILVGVRSKDVFSIILSFEKDDKMMKSIQSLSDNTQDKTQINCLKWAIKPGAGIMIGYTFYPLRYLRQF